MWTENTMLRFGGQDFGEGRLVGIRESLAERAQV